MEYLISEREIARRKKAYLNLSISLIIGVVSGSTIFHSPFVSLSLVLVVVTLFLIGASSFAFFRKLTKVKILLSNDSLQRITKTEKEIYPLVDINKVVIKWTTNKTIREIYIWLSNGESIFISALDRFEQFRIDLLGSLNTKVSIREKYEPLNFDHPLFYTMFGLSIGSFGVLGFKSLINMSHQQMKIGLFIFTCYLIAMGVYFAITKPISTRLGKITKFLDLIIATLMLFFGILVFLSMLNS